MKVIGHRGACGLETENSLASIQRALALGVDGIELDVWTSRDDVPILSHDSNLGRLTRRRDNIFNMDLGEIRQRGQERGLQIITADEALEAAGDTEVFLDIKDYYLSRGILRLLDEYRSSNILVTSANHSVLMDLHKRRPDLRLSPSTLWRPVETIHMIKKHGFYSLSLYYHTFNPFIYWVARHYGIDIRLYTVNNPRYVNMLRRFKFDVDVCTDYPNLLLPLVRA